jgi:hypothetical protein
MCHDGEHDDCGHATPEKQHERHRITDASTDRFGQWLHRGLDVHRDVELPIGFAWQSLSPSPDSGSRMLSEGTGAGNENLDRAE